MTTSKVISQDFLGLNDITEADIEKLMNNFRLHQKDKLPLDSADDLMRLTIKVIKSTPAPYEKLQFDVGQIESIYSLGYQAYNNGKFSQAIDFFRLAYLLNPLDERYLFSLGLSLEKNKDYMQASMAYYMWSFIEEESPLGFFRAGICNLEMGETTVADHFLVRAIERCGNQEQFMAVKERAQLFRAGLAKDA